MSKQDFILKEENGLYYHINGKCYDRGRYNHLHHCVLNEKEMLVEYYKRISNPSDSSILGKWEVWIYGDDRPHYPPHCHLLYNRKDDKTDINIEIHLHDLEAYHMEFPENKNITWNDIGNEARDRFMTWLSMPKTNDKTNAQYLFDWWDGENSQNNTIKMFVEKHNLEDKVHPLVKEYLYGKPIDNSELVSSFFSIVLPLYQNDKVERERLHHINDPIEFAKEAKLPFNFNSFNITPKILNIITKHEKMCYEMTK